MPEVDEYGIPVKKNKSTSSQPQTDEFGIPVKKKVGSGENGTSVKTGATETRQKLPLASPGQTDIDGKGFSLDPTLVANKPAEVKLQPQPRQSSEPAPKRTTALAPESPVKSNPKIVVNGESYDVPSDIDLPVINEKYAEALQQRIDSKAYDINDLNVISRAIKKVPASAEALLRGKKYTSDVIDTAENNKKKKEQQSLIVADVNKQLGLTDNINVLDQSYEAMAAYRDKAEKAYSDRIAKELKTISDKPFDGGDGGFTPLAIAQNSQNNQDLERNKILEKNSDALAAVTELKKSVNAAIVEKINNDNSLSHAQKSEKIMQLTGKDEADRNKKAIKEELTPFNYLKRVAVNISIPGSETVAQRREPLQQQKALVELALSADNGKKLFEINSQIGAAVEDMDEKIGESMKKFAPLIKDDKFIGSAEQYAEYQQVAKQGDVYKAKVESLRGEAKRIEAEYVAEKDVVKKYPVLYKGQVVNAINNFSAIKSDNIEGGADGGYKGVTISDHLKANGFDITNQITKDLIEEYNDMQNPSGLSALAAAKEVSRTLFGKRSLKDYSLFGNVVGSVAGVFSETGKAVGDLTNLVGGGIRTDLDVLAEKKESELFPTTIGKTEDYQLSKKADFLHNVSETTGQVIGQGLLQAGTIGLGRAAGLTKLAASNVGFWSSGALTSYDQAYKDSFDFTDNKGARVAYAGLIALSNAASEKIFPEAKLFQIPGVQDAIAELTKKIGTRGFTEALAEELLSKAKNSFIKGIKDYSVAYGKNIGSEVVEETATSLFESATRFVFGDKTMNIDKALTDARETAIQTATGSVLIGGFGAHKDVANEKSTSNKATIYNAALYHDTALDAINKGFDEGKYDAEERNAKIQTLNTAKNALVILAQTEKTLGVDLSRPEKALYVANLTAESLLTKQLKEITDSGTVDSILKQSIETKISNLENQRKQIISGDVNLDDDGDIVVPKQKEPTPEEIRIEKLAKAKAGITEVPDLLSSKNTDNENDQKNAEGQTNASSDAQANAKTNEGQQDGQEQGQNVENTEAGVPASVTKEPTRTIPGKLSVEEIERDNEIESLFKPDFKIPVISEFKIANSGANVKEGEANIEKYKELKNRATDYKNLIECLWTPN